MTHSPLIIFLSFRREVILVFSTFIAILFLPVFAAFVVSNTGIQSVSDILISENSVTKQIEIYDPLTQKVVGTISKKVVRPANGVVSLEFGRPHLPYQAFHTGIDIAGWIGSPVRASMAGTVVHTGELSWGFGKHVIIDNQDNISTLYGHLNMINVKNGQNVKAGEVIGEMGSTGWSTGPHLHFQVNVFGIPVNPMTLLLEESNL